MSGVENSIAGPEWFFGPRFILMLTEIFYIAIVSVRINLTITFRTMTTTPENVQQYDLRILRALRRITRAVALHSRQLSAVSNITAPQLVCLRAVVENGPLTATALSREIHVSASTVVGILDRLEDKGLVRRERGREDRRIVFLWPTEAGIALAQGTPSPLQQKLAESLNELPELEQATITLSLERIVDLMESRGVAVPESAGDIASPILEVPDTGALPESGLAIE